MYPGVGKVCIVGSWPLGEVDAGLVEERERELDTRATAGLRLPGVISCAAGMQR
jgi:hypothetical protein